MLPLYPQDPLYVPHYYACYSATKLELEDLNLPLKHINFDGEICLTRTSEKPRSPSVVFQYEWSPHSTREDQLAATTSKTL